ncbi:MAG: GntR family transcriptional regulator [Bryobacteraceae bacterium]
MAAAKPQPQPFAFGLDPHSGVPVYRQLIDQVLSAIASGALRPTDRLPTVRRVAVDLAINPNTVVRAYKELEIRGVLETQQGTGTFIAEKKVRPDELARRRRLEQIVTDTVSRAAAEGFMVGELIEILREMKQERK